MKEFKKVIFSSKEECVTCVIVAGDDENDLEPYGSGFLVAQNLAFTARHVIDAIFDHFTGKKPYELENHQDFGVQLASTDPSTGDLVMWNVLDYHYSKDIDIAALSIEPAEKIEIQNNNIPEINLLPPFVDESITAHGYPNSKSIPLQNGSFKVRLDPHTTKGIIKDVHYDYRDKPFLKFPCFQTNARFDAGMSGGPVYNNNNQICGVVCSSLPAETESEEDISYVSLIWPVFGLRLNETTTGKKSSDPTFLRDLAKKGHISTQNLECINIEITGKSDVLHFRKPAKKE